MTIQTCTCPKSCDCQNPEPKNSDIAHCSNLCPVHNLYPIPDEECPIHGHMSVSDYNVCLAVEARQIPLIL